MIKNYDGEKFEDLKDLTIVDFYADWCGPCKMMAKSLEELKDIDIIKVNVDENEDLAKEYKVMSIPNLVFIKDGKEIENVVGFMSKYELEDVIERLK